MQWTPSTLNLKVDGGSLLLSIADHSAADPARKIPLLTNTSVTDLRGFYSPFGYRRQVTVF